MIHHRPHFYIPKRPLKTGLSRPIKLRLGTNSKLKLRDLRSIDQRSKFFSHLTNYGVSADYLLFIELKHAATNNYELQKRYRVTFELTDNLGQLQWLAYVDVLKGNAPPDSQPEHTNSRTVTRRYSVGSFVTDNFFAGKVSYDTKEVYDNYETEIEKSLQITRRGSET